MLSRLEERVKKLVKSIVPEGVQELRKKLYSRYWWNKLTENDKRIILGLIRIYFSLREVEGGCNE